MSWDQMINPGSSNWNVIERNQLSADMSSSACHALPDVADWDQVSAPAATNQGQWTLRRNDKNGSPVIDITFQINWEFGSTYRGGGAFIRTCWLTVPNLFVGFGYDVDMHAVVEPPLNVGTTTAPNGVLRISVLGNCVSPYWTQAHRKSIAVRGDGAVQI